MSTYEDYISRIDNLLIRREEVYPVRNDIYHDLMDEFTGHLLAIEDGSDQATR